MNPSAAAARALAVRAAYCPRLSLVGRVVSVFEQWMTAAATAPGLRGERLEQ